jgi:Effector protein
MGAVMGFWPFWKYADYVRTHGQGADQIFLLGPYEESLDGEADSIVLAFHSMPRWMDRFDVSFDDSAVNFRRNLHKYRVARDQYIREVRAQFELLKSWLMGKALLAEIRRTNNRVRIIPYWDYSHLNADASPWDGVNETAGKTADWIAATAKGAAGWLDAGGRPVIGTGTGTGSEVRYTPGMLHPIDGDPAWAPDEVLFHELVHASREMRGVFFRMPVNKGYDDLEEYIAIILCNIYLSEKGQETFRGNHRSRTFSPDYFMSLRGADANNFLTNSQRVDTRPTMVIQNFKDSQPEFYRDVVNLPPGRPKYNWVKQYDQEATKLVNQVRKPR